MRLHRAARAFLDPELQSGAITPAEAHAFLRARDRLLGPVRAQRGRALHLPRPRPGDVVLLRLHQADRAAGRGRGRARRALRPAGVPRLHRRPGPHPARRAARRGPRPLRPRRRAAREPAQPAEPPLATRRIAGSTTVKATVYHGERDVRVETVPDPRSKPRPTRSCGSSTPRSAARTCGPTAASRSGQPGSRIGHEFTGVVEAVGADVRGVAVGQFVAAPFSYAEGHCAFCRDGLYTSCKQAGFWGGLDDDGGQGEFVRVPFADATLVAIPDAVRDDAGQAHRGAGADRRDGHRLPRRGRARASGAATTSSWSATARSACARCSRRGISARSASSRSATTRAGWSWRAASARPRRSTRTTPRPRRSSTTRPTAGSRTSSRRSATRTRSTSR